MYIVKNIIEKIIEPIGPQIIPPKIIEQNVNSVGKIDQLSQISTISDIISKDKIIISGIVIFCFVIIDFISIAEMLLPDKKLFLYR